MIYIICYSLYLIAIYIMYIYIMLQLYYYFFLVYIFFFSNKFKKQLVIINQLSRFFYSIYIREFFNVNVEDDSINWSVTL